MKNKIRDLKLGLINGDINYQFKCDLKRLRKGNNKIFNKFYWRIIKKHKDCVITGSASLYAFGLIDREPHDLDFLIDVEKNKDFISKLKPIDGYNGEEEINCIGRYTNHAKLLNGLYDGYGYCDVDFFELNDSKNIIEIDGYKFHHPLDIISTKSTLVSYRHKDITDINMCIERIYEGKGN